MGKIQDLEMKVAKAKREMESAQWELDAIRNQYGHVWNYPDGTYQPIPHPEDSWIEEFTQDLRQAFRALPKRKTS